MNYHIFIKSVRNRPGVITLMGVLLSVSIAASLYAVDDDVKKMIRRATGITDEDVKTASGKKDITLFDAFALAVHKTERMAIEGENAIQAEERKLQAIESFLPYVSLRANKAFPEPDTRYVNLARSAVSLYLRQPIVTGLKEASQIKAAWSDRKIRECQLNNNANQMLMDVGTAYYTVLLMEHDLRNNEQLLELHNKTLAEIRRRVDIGRSRQSDLLRTNAQIYSLQAHVKSIRTGLEHAKLVFAAMTGIESDYVLADTLNLNDPPFSLRETEKIVDGRWDVRAAKEQMEYSKAGVMAAYGTHLPNVYFEGSYFLWQDSTYKTDRSRQLTHLALSSNPAGSLLGSRLNNGNPVKSRDYYFSLGAELPIFGGDVTFAKVREANSKKRQADLGFSQTVRLARKDVLDSFQTWEGAKVELEAYRRALASAEQNYQVVSSEYRLNQVTILDVLVSLTNLQSARYDYERALLQLKLNRVRLGVSINEFSGEKIRTIR
ncbi:MAG TPA: TolC family protein [Spirochaetota bacterium]|nr:TolC family protein [Spirochaetota bacterium]HPV39638.1 TolC family protein [Spirochaetota bacterium]